MGSGFETCNSFSFYLIEKCYQCIFGGNIIDFENFKTLSYVRIMSSLYILVGVPYHIEVFQVSKVVVSENGICIHYLSSN